MKIAIVGNCQADPLANVFRMAVPGSLVNVFVVQRERTAGELTAALRDIEDADVTFAQPIAGTFGVLSTSSLVERSKRVIQFPNVYYRGLHPDLTYVGGADRRVQGPLGDYHSLVVLHALIAGMTPAECVAEYDRLLSRLTNPALIASTSKVELAKRCSEINFPGDELADVLMGPSISMLTVNHPTTATMVWLAKACLRSAAVSTGVDWAWLEVVVDNPLLRSVAWPIAPSAAELHGLPESGKRAFRGSRGSVYDLSTFVRMSFEAYEGFDREQLHPRRPDIDLVAVGFGLN
jgi:hypothetical protein